jgi:hypothetical protein
MGWRSAVRPAKNAAGAKDVLVLGAEIARQLLRAGLLDELRIHLVSLLMGEGTPLFAGERAGLIPLGKPVAGAATHLRYRVLKPCRRIRRGPPVLMLLCLVKRSGVIPLADFWPLKRGWCWAGLRTRQGGATSG